VGTEASLDQVYAEVKRMRLELKSLERSLESIAEWLIHEEKVTSEELREIVVLKKEAVSGECVFFEDVLKKHGAKSFI
jgi:predicted HTH transcriptional regulator